MTNPDNFFIGVHAAEALIANNYTEGIKSHFDSLLRASPANRIGCYRILATLNKDNPSEFKFYIRKLKELFLHADNEKQQLTALETLAKLGFHDSLPEIIQLADFGENGFKSVSRWVLANSGKIIDENRLAAMLASGKGEDRLYAAYSFRFIKRISLHTYAFLDSCTNQLDNNDTDRIYFVCACYIHSEKGNAPETKAAVLKYITGNKEEHYELAEALAIKGNRSDLPVVEKLLLDNDQDVRVAAANACLKIKKRADNLRS